MQDEYIIWINSNDKISGTNNDFVIDMQGLLPKDFQKWKVQLIKLVIPYKIVDIDLDANTDSKQGYQTFNNTGNIMLMCDLNSSNVKNTSIPSNGSILLIDNTQYYQTMNSILYYTGAALTNFNARNSFFNGSNCYINNDVSVEFLTNQYINFVNFVNFKLYNYVYATHGYTALLNEDLTAINDVIICLKFTACDLNNI